MKQKQYESLPDDFFVGLDVLLELANEEYNGPSNTFI